MTINPVIGSLCCLNLYVFKSSTIPLTSSSVVSNSFLTKCPNNWVSGSKILICIKTLDVYCLAPIEVPAQIHPPIICEQTPFFLPIFGSPGCDTLSFHQDFSFSALIIREVKDFAMSGSLSSSVACLLVSLCSLS